MFNLFSQPVKDIVFIFGHAVRRPEEGPRLYAVGAAILRQGGEKQIFTSLVAHSRLTGRERYASNVTEKMLETAPSAADVSEKLQRFLGDRPFFFALDESDAMAELQAFSGLARFVDLGFSAEFFLPDMRGYHLKSLWEYLSGKERERIGFTVEEGLDLSINLVRYIAGHCTGDDHTRHAPVLRHFLRKSDTLFGAAFLHLHRHYQEYFGGRSGIFGEKESDNWRVFLEKADRDEQKSKEHVARKISEKDLENLYAGLAASVEGFTYRQEQVEYAGHVANALNEAAVLTIEAGTGTGKTLGYLLPAMEYLRVNPGEHVVISTYTKNLQEQIFHNEIAFVRQALPGAHELRVVLLKGKTSYVCVEKLDSLYEESLKGEKLLSWLYCLHTAFCFRQADLGAVGERVRRYFHAEGRFSRMLKEVSAGNGCPPSHTRCPAQVVTAQARKANLVITNHHKLALLDRDPLLAGCFHHYIIDEANHFEPAIRNAFGQVLHSRDIQTAARYLETRFQAIFEKHFDAAAPKPAQSMEDFRALEQAVDGFKDTLTAIDPKAALGAVHPLPYDHPVFIDGRVRSRIEALCLALETVVGNFRWLKDDNTCRRLKVQQRIRRRLEIHLELLDETIGTLKSIMEAIVHENNITVYQIFRRHWSIAVQRIQVGDLIRERIYDKKKCIVFTAATLCDRIGFRNFQEITGMSASLTIENHAAPRKFRFVRIPSPFPRTAMEMIVDSDAVSGKYDNKEAWIEAVARTLPKLIRANQGRTLVLFSSYQDLERVFDRIGSGMEDLRYPLLVQRPGQDTVSLCDEFRAVKESVLFGVDTFWYGVDFKGDTLTQVVITRIPYPSPNDPIQAARRHALTPKDFWERYRYDTDIKMKQGIGRLIRCETDRGKVVILDSRYRV